MTFVARRHRNRHKLVPAPRLEAIDGSEPETRVFLVAGEYRQTLEPSAEDRWPVDSESPHTRIIGKEHDLIAAAKGRTES